MEENSAMAITDTAVNSEQVVNNGAKRQKSDSSCFSFMEISIEPVAGIKSLKHLDSKKFKSEIKRWAKAVVGYARQVSDRFGSSRRSSPSNDSTNSRGFSSIRISTDQD